MKNEINTIESNYQASFVASKLLNSTTDLNNLFLIRNWQRRDHSAAVISLFGASITLSIATLGLASNMVEGLTAMGLAKTVWGTRAIAIASRVLSLLSVSGRASSTGLRTLMRAGTKLWVLFVLSVLVVILMKIFGKSELELFISNSVLGDHKLLPDSEKNKHPASVMQYLYNHRHIMVPDRFAHLRQFDVALTELEDSLPPFGVFMKKEEDYYYKTDSLTFQEHILHRGTLYLIVYHSLPNDAWSMDLGLVFTNHEKDPVNLHWKSHSDPQQIYWLDKHLQQETHTDLLSLFSPVKIYFQGTSSPKSIREIITDLQENDIPSFVIDLKMNDCLNTYISKSRNATLYVYARLRYNALWDSDKWSTIADGPDTFFYPKSNESEAVFNVIKIPLKYTIPSILAPTGAPSVYGSRNPTDVKYYKSTKKDMFK